MNQSVKFILRIFFLFILSLPIQAFCQDSKYQQIETLLQKAQTSRKKFKNQEQLKYARQANILAKETGDSQKIAESYYQMASALCFLELQKMSFTYLNKAAKEPYFKKSKLIQAQTIEIKAFNYYSLGLTVQFDNELPKILVLLKGQEDKESAILKQRVYLNIGASKPDSTLYYSNLCSQELKRFPEKEVFAELSDLYRYIGTDFLSKKSDSALHYFNKSMKINQKYGEKALFIDFTNIGDYYSEKGQPEKAIDFYAEAIENIKEQSLSPYNFLNNDLYRKISELYGKLGNTDKKTEYLKQYGELQKRLAAEQNKNVDLASKIILSDQQHEYEQAQRKKYTWIAVGILALLIVFFLVYILLKNRIKHREALINEANQNINQKNEIISKKNIETEELQLKVNDVYSEVTELARTNDGSFYFRFQEVYPEFQKKLLDYNSELRTSELILCAYIFLNFNSKNIAEYTFKSVNTVRNRKQNLRKKFNIPTEQNIRSWLINLVDVDTKK